MNVESYETVDDWLQEQSVDIPTAIERTKWSAIYLSDAWTDVFNHLQTKLFGNYSQWVSRFLALATIVVPLVVLWWV